MQPLTKGHHVNIALMGGSISQRAFAEDTLEGTPGDQTWHAVLHRCGECGHR